MLQADKQLQVISHCLFFNINHMINYDVFPSSVHGDHLLYLTAQVM